MTLSKYFLLTSRVSSLSAVTFSSVPSFLDPAWRNSFYMRHVSLVIKQKEQESWQSWVIALAEFCLKLAYIISASISFAKVGHLVKQKINGIGDISFPVGGILQITWQLEIMESLELYKDKMCLCVYMLLL